MKRYASDPQYQRIEREADLIFKSAVYHAVQEFRNGPIRPPVKDNMDKYLRGKL